MFAFGFPFNVYMCGHTYVQSVCVCGPEVDVWSPFQLISTLFIEVEFLSLSEVLLIYIIWLADLFCVSSYPPCYENDSLSTTSTHNICGFYGSEHQSSCLCAKNFAIRAISSALYLQLLYACIRDNC